MAVKLSLYAYRNLDKVDQISTILSVIGVKGAEEKASALLNKCNSLSGILSKTPKELQGILGIRSAEKLLLFKEVALLMAKEKMYEERYSILSDESVVEYYTLCYRGLKREEFRMIYLNSKGDLIGDSLLSIGTVNTAPVYIREVLVSALEYGAVGVILIHNHPGGSRYPSEEDRESTKKIQKALDLIKVKLYDHIVISEEGHYSFAKEENYLVK